MSTNDSAEERWAYQPALPKELVGPLSLLVWLPLVYGLVIMLRQQVGQPTATIPDPTVWYPYIDPITRHGEWAVPLVPIVAVVVSIPVLSAVYTFLVGGSRYDFLRINQTFFLFGLFNASGALTAVGAVGFLWALPIFGLMIFAGIADESKHLWIGGGLWLASGMLLLVGIGLRELKLRLAGRWRIGAFFSRNVKRK